MNRLILFVIMSLSMFGSAYAQPKCHVDLDYCYNLGFSEKYVGRHYGRSAYKMGGNSLRIATRYDISNKLSAGAGVGLDRYTETDFNTMPVFARLHYSPFEKGQNVYMFSDIGYALKVAQDYNPGFTGKIGFGYLLHITKHFGMNFKVAYDFKDFRKISTISYDEGNDKITFYDSNSLRHSVSFGVGVTF